MVNAADDEAAFYPLDNIRRKSEAIRLDYGAIHACIVEYVSNANRHYMLLKCKQEHSSGCQHTVP